MTDATIDFEGRSALITGAGSGIGAACAKGLAARGASRLFLNDIEPTGLDQLDLGECEVVPFVGSVADPELWAGIEGDLAGIDHAIVNAGIGTWGKLTEIDHVQWRKVMGVNVDGAFLTLSTAMRAMAANGGSVCVVSSATGLKAMPGVGPYGVSKAAIAHMSRIAAVEGAANGIRVNAIAPGGVDTPIWDTTEGFRQAIQEHGREAVLKESAKDTPRGQFATAPEIADTILYLLSDAAANMTGHVLVSDGGFTL
jgi:NAD(P)-dependent dehydrogenase (short-subunit alcohol dehydrogenase family)